MFAVFENVLVLFVFLIIGFSICATGLADNKTSKLLSTLLVYVFLPAKIIQSMSRDFTIAYITEKYMLLIVAVILIVLNMALFYPISKKIANNDYEKYVYWYALVAPNFGYFGYPLAESLFGDIGLLNLIIFATPTSLFCYTIGFFVLTKTPANFKSMLKKPPLIATIVGAILGLSSFGMPGAVTTIIDSAGACMGPVAMILLGMVISEFSPLQFIKDAKLYIMSALRLIVIPLTITFVVSLFCNKDVTVTTAMMYAMPYGLNTVVYAKLVGEDCRVGAGLATISTLISCITIPLVISLFI